MKLTLEQKTISDALVEKFKDRIYAKHGDLNLRIVKQIALAAGLKTPYVEINSAMGYLMINCEIVDPYGNAEGEISSIYSLCVWMKTQGH